MNNLFDVENYPTSEPDILVAGDRWAWKRSDIADVYPTGSYTLKYRFTSLGGGTGISITADKVDGVHVVQVSQDTSSSHNSDEYSWQAFVVRDSDDEVLTVDRGFCSVHPALGWVDGTTQSWVYEVLTAIRATIKGTASTDQQSFAVAGRELARRTPAELLELERDFASRWEAEKKAVARKFGRTVNSRVLMKMGA